MSGPEKRCSHNSFLQSCHPPWWSADNCSIFPTVNNIRNKKRTGRGSQKWLKNWKKKISCIFVSVGLNFIRLLRVVITPSVIVERRKRLEAIGWISGYVSLAYRICLTLRCSYVEDMKHFSSGTGTGIIFLVIFAGLALKLANVGPTFSSFNPCPSLPSSATESTKRFQCLNIVLSNRTRLLLEFNLWGKGFTFFIKTLQMAWHSPYERANWHTIAKFPSSVCVLSKRLV